MTEGEVQKKGGAGKAIGIGCLIIVLILTGLGFYVVKNIKKIGRAAGAGLVTMATESVIKESGLSAQEQAAIMAPIKGLAEEFKAGNITMDDLGTIMGKISEGPLISLITVTMIDKNYIDASTLSQADKDAAHKTVSRYAEACARGEASFMDNNGELGALLTVKTKDDEGNPTTEIKDTLTDQELEQCLVIMKNSADTAGIADKTFTIDVGKAISDAIAAAKADLSK